MSFTGCPGCECLWPEECMGSWLGPWRQAVFFPGTQCSCCSSEPQLGTISAFAISRPPHPAATCVFCDACLVGLRLLPVFPSHIPRTGIPITLMRVSESTSSQSFRQSLWTAQTWEGDEGERVLDLSQLPVPLRAYKRMPSYPGS